MASPPSVLPSPRQMLTSLIDSVSSIPAPGGSDSDDSHGGSAEDVTSRRRRPNAGAAAANPLSQIKASYRPLFTALHALFPSLLLPALDLLDRGLVTRLVLGHYPDASGGGGGAAAAGVYHVRSTAGAQHADGSGRRGRKHGSSRGEGNGGGGPAYVVQLRAWNCSCAAFAFSAFPPADAGRLFAPGDEECAGGGDRPARYGAERTLEEESEPVGGSSCGGGEEPSPCKGWQFGGLSLDGAAMAVPEQQHQSVPCCKHLLACVLADRWAPLGRFVAVRRISREELAGVLADV